MFMCIFATITLSTLSMEHEITEPEDEPNTVTLTIPALKPDPRQCTRENNFIQICAQPPVDKHGALFRESSSALTYTERIKKESKLCMLAILAHLKSALQHTEEVKECHQITSYIRSSSNLYRPSEITQRASALLLKILNLTKNPKMTTLILESLPFDVNVEIEALFEIEGMKKTSGAAFASGDYD